MGSLLPRGEKNKKGSLANITLHSIHIEAAMRLFEANATDIQVIGRLRYKIDCVPDVLLQYASASEDPRKSNGIIRQLRVFPSSRV